MSIYLLTKHVGVRCKDDGSFTLHTLPSCEIGVHAEGAPLDVVPVGLNALLHRARRGSSLQLLPDEVRILIRPLVFLL